MVVVCACEFVFKIMKKKNILFSSFCTNYLKTLRALMKHPRQTLVANQFTTALCSEICVHYPHQNSIAMTVPFSVKCFVCASLSASKPSDKLNKPNPADPLQMTKMQAKATTFFSHFTLVKLSVLYPSTAGLGGCSFRYSKW